MRFLQKENGVLIKHQGEILMIEPWGKDSLRVRATKYPEFSGKNWALEEEVCEECKKAEYDLHYDHATVTNGRISVSISSTGVLSFFKDGKRFLHEYHRSYDGRASKESICLKIVGRTYQPIIGGDYGMTVRFESNNNEKIFGMGQYQQNYLDLKGCKLELAQRNSQISIPFALSSLGYGFLWNNPGVGYASFGKNMTEWHADATKEIDYWITVADTPASIIENYTAVTGRAPKLPEGVLGLWQSKLRYRTQDEVMEVAREYKRLGIKLDVIVIDFFHWTRQGDWHFDPVYWPDPKAMCDELHAMGTKVIVSVWPSVDRKSENFYEMMDRGLLISTEHGSQQTYDFQGDCIEIDVTNPEAREYIWEKCKKNYYDYGIDMFWLDNAEPDYGIYDYANYRYQMGTALSCSNIYPKLYAQAFTDGIRKEGREADMLHLVRCGWVGSQKNATLLWSGDVSATFECLQDQMKAGINMGVAGIPWWTTDIGGFITDDCHSEEFKELLVRWFEYAVFTPFLRMHGDRGPHDIAPLSDLEYGGGYLYTGHSNELWSYGEEVFELLMKQLKLRESIIPYIKELMDEASKTGAPLIRGMFYEFPEDAKCWELEEQYMFGNKYLVAPVMEAGVTELSVYLPAGQKWKNINDDTIYEGGQTITAPAPLEMIPVFERI